MTKDLIHILQKELQKTKKYKITLDHSFKKSNLIKVKKINDYTIDELDVLETLTSRFARVSDILIKKIFRVIEAIDLEEKGTIRDLINQAEKKLLISSADEFIKIRELRNLIAHEYQEEDLSSIFQQVISLTPTILKTVDNVAEYSKKYETK